LSDEWDFYFARVNDAVSSIFVDLGIRPDVPVETRPWLLWVWVKLQSPNPDGLSTSDEAPKLNAIGEALDATVSATCGAQLVGRITGNSRREFYFYAAEPGELTASVANAMKVFAEYTYETGSTFQPEWEQYLMLYPSETNLERMKNRRVLEALAEQGDSHTIPRKVDHWLYFGDEASRAACRETLAAIDFAVEDEGMAEEDGGLQSLIDADLRFHRAVLKAAHNPYLEMVLDPVMSTFLQQIKLSNSFNPGLDMHRHIFIEIRERNSVGARQAVRRLMKSTLEDSRRALKNIP